MIKKTKIISVTLAVFLCFTSVFAYVHYNINKQEEHITFDDRIEISGDEISKARIVDVNIGSGGGDNYRCC